MRQLVKALRKWNREVFGHCQSRIDDLIQKIMIVQGMNHSKHKGSIESSLQAKLSEWLVYSEVLWRQKSRELWLKVKDKNSSFFHLSTIIRRRQNNIDVIRADNGTWVIRSRNIKHFFLDKFKDRFSEEEVSFPNHFKNLIHTTISEEDNEWICAIPPVDEIRATLFKMQDLKAPRPNDFLVAIYKAYWPIVEENVILLLSR